MPRHRVVDPSQLERVGPQLGAWPGGSYRAPVTGERWYVKAVENARQRHNSVLASRLLREMGFRAAEVRPTSDGRVASRWIDGLPDETDRDELRPRAEARETFLPAALIAHWDVAGKENMLPDPEDPDGVVLLDFGGTFDTRSLGASKPYPADEVPALSGFLDPAINRPAYELYNGLTRTDYERSRARLRALDEGTVAEAVASVFPPEAKPSRRATVLRRCERLLATPYDAVFA